MNPDSPGLFIDCDDTLVLWLDPDGHVDESSAHPYGMGSERYVHNQLLLEGVREWREKNDGPIVVWSGGGSDYALRFVLETGIPCDATADKDPGVPREGDICVDDDEWFLASSKGTVMSWRKFLEHVNVEV